MRYKRVVAGLGACAALWAGAAANAGVNQWTIKGPPGGIVVRDLEASTTNPDVFYVSYNRMLARSTDGAVTWQSIGNFTGEVVDIAVDPTDGNRIYVANIEEGLFRSDNGGDSFVQIAPGSDYIWAVGVGGADGRTVYYAGGPGKFYRSLDRGANWTERTQLTQGINHILVEGADGLKILANHGDTIKRSNDGGDSWTTIQLSSTVWALLRVSASSLLAATSDGIQISTNDGASWTPTGGGTAWTLARDPLTPTTIYAGGFSFGPIMRSTDSGVTWNAFGANLLADVRGLAATSSGATTRLVGATLAGVVRSTNGGTSWTESTSGPVASSPLFATTVAANSRVYAYSPGDSLHSTSMDNGWQRIDLTPARAAAGWFGPTQAALAVAPGAPRTIYLVPFGRSGLRSTDGGTSWVQTGLQLNGLAVTALGTDPLDARVMYTSVQRAFGAPLASLYRSTDSGANWVPHSVDLGDVYPLQIVVDPADVQRIYLASYQGFGAPNSGGLYRSTDGGLHWTERGFQGLDVRRVGVDSSDSNRLYAATALGLQVSTNGGDTFTRNTPFALLSALPQSGAVVVDPVVPSTLYASSFDNGNFAPQQPSLVARSVDRGQTWEVLHAANDGPPWYVVDMVLDPNLPSLLYVNTGVRGVAAFEVQNDLSVAISGHSGTRPIGVLANFSVRVQNNGGLAATAVRLDLALPGGLTDVALTPSSGSCTATHCDFPVLRPGQFVDVGVQYRPPAAMNLPVTALVAAHERDNASANDSAQASAQAGEVVDLRATITPSATTLDHGDSFTYQVQVTNDGPVTASVATVTFAAGTGVTLGAAPPECAAAAVQLICVYTNIATGASRTISIAASAGGIGSLSSSVSVAGAVSASDTNPANNAASVAITSRAVADLGITATDSADPVQAGAAFTYAAEVRNNGPDEMPAVTATLTAAGTVTAVTTTRGTCTSSGTGVNCALGALASGATASITVSTAVGTAGTNTLHAVVAGGGTDKVAGNNAVDQATVINAPPSSSSSSGGGGGGGGGGSLDAAWLMLGLWLLARRRQPRGVAPRS